MKFHENILNGFQVIDGTQSYHCRISKGNNSKNVLISITVLMLCTSTDYALYFYEVSLNVLNGFQVTERTRNYHCQISKGSNSKTVWTRASVLIFRISPNDSLYSYEVS